jgi:hypothetical protein
MVYTGLYSQVVVIYIMSATTPFHMQDLHRCKSHGDDVLNTCCLVVQAIWNLVANMQGLALERQVQAVHKTILISAIIGLIHSIQYDSTTKLNFVALILMMNYFSYTSFI